MKNRILELIEKSPGITDEKAASALSISVKSLIATIDVEIRRHVVIESVLDGVRTFRIHPLLAGKGRCRSKSRARAAIDLLASVDCATTDQLMDVMGLNGVHPCSYLSTYLRRGEVVRENDLWTLGDCKPRGLSAVLERIARMSAAERNSVRMYLNRVEEVAA